MNLPNTVTKISIEGKIICTTGDEHLGIWYIYENSVKEFKNGVKGLNVSRVNFVDHSKGLLI